MTVVEPPEPMPKPSIVAPGLLRDHPLLDDPPIDPEWEDWAADQLDRPHPPGPG